MTAVIRGGQVVTPQSTFPGTVVIEGERIAALHAGDWTAAGAVEYDASGCYVIPGAVDPHTHIEMPAGDLGYNADDWESGTAAALLGGTTTVIDMVTPEPGQPLPDALEGWRRRAARRSLCDYSFHMGIVDGSAERLEEMGTVVASGVPSFKIYLAYKGRLQVGDAVAFQILRRAGALGAVVCVHAENGDVIELLVEEARAQGLRHAGMHAATRPPQMEGEATGRILALARLAGTVIYVVHVTCREALAAIRAARAAGQAVFAEVCAHHLVLTDQVYRLPGFAAAPYVLSPPLRSAEDRDALWAALADGTLDCTATDHCPWNLKGQKDRGQDDFARIPNGAGGIEERLCLLWTHGVEAGRWTVEQFVARTATAAARIFGLYPRKGALLPGADADVVVWDPAVARTLGVAGQASRVDHSIYEGMPVRGAPRYVFRRGHLVVREGRLVAAGGGQEVLRPARAHRSAAG